MAVTNIAELKLAIANLPDDMEVKGYNGGNGDLHSILHWTVTEDTLTEEEVREGYPDGVTPTFVISVD